jgi:cytochrome c oxidase subunit IV
MKFGPTLKIVTFLAVFIAVLFAIPYMPPSEWLWRILIILGSPVLFIYLGVQAVLHRSGIVIALVVFAAGLIVELFNFAMLYRIDGVYRAVPRQQSDNTVQMAFVKRHDLFSCALMSIHVWTSGGDGSLVANPSATWLTSLELVMGYMYMAIFIAILVAVLQQEYFGRRGAG